MLLERADDLEKPKLIANAFKAYLYEEITYSQLQRINFAVDHLFIGDLKDYGIWYQKPQYTMDECVHQNLQLCGIVDLELLVDGCSRLIKNELGNLFAEKILFRR